MSININYAKQLFSTSGFSPYSAAYIVTNEDLRYALEHMPKDTKNALVVAASGDHPLFTALYGAQYIDTFDISFNAKLIMDIKTYALQLLNRRQYCKLLIDIQESKDVSTVKHMQPIIEKLTTAEQKYLYQMRGNMLFAKNGYVCPLSLPYNQEFKKMKKTITEPFNFIWSDIRTLHKKLTKRYDFMHLSNILDYQDMNSCVYILHTLTKYTKPGSIICFENVVWSPERIDTIFTSLTPYVNNDEKQMWEFHKQNGMFYTMNRVR